MSSETNTPQNPSSPAAQQEPKTDQAPSPEAKIVTSEQLQPRIDLCATVEVAGETWLDQVHDYADRKLCQPAVWFDAFFGDDVILENVRPTVFISLRNSARWTEGQGFELIPDYKFRYRLPEMEKLLARASFFVESASTVDKFTYQPGQPVDPGINPSTGARQPAFGVGISFFKWLRSLATIDLGIKASVPLDPFARFRYQYTKSLGEDYLIRFTETALQRLIEHFTETSQLDLEKKLSTFTLIRWSNFVTVTDGISGITWNTGISLLTQLTPKSAISYDTSMWGVNHPEWYVQDCRVGIKYRRNFYRPWLFFELAPEITWPQDASGRRISTDAFMVTLEIQLGK